MLSAQWMKLVIILGLISYSYEYNRRNGQSRRRARESELKYTTQEEINAIMRDDGQLEQRVKDQMRRNEDIIKEITQSIIEAVSKMADVGVHEVTNLERWNIIQREIRRGLNVVIVAYRTFIKLQRVTCDSLENFANDIISRYESELNAVDQLTPPILSTGNIDIDSPLYSNFRDKFFDMLKYAQFRRSTFPTDLDCPHDLSAGILTQRAAIVNPVPSTYYVQVQPQLQPQIQPLTLVRSVPIDQGIPISCGSLSEYNGCHSCPYSIVNQARSLFTNACPNQCVIH